MARTTPKSERDSPLLARTRAQDATLKDIARRTARLKNEQYRIVDKDGNVLVTEKGNEDTVHYTDEMRENIWGNISIHNHPSEGVFSPDDLYDLGRGAREIVVASGDTMYRLVNMKFVKEGMQTARNWRDLSDEMERIHEANSNFLAVTEEVNRRIKTTKAWRELDALDRRGEDIIRRYGVRSDEMARYREETREDRARLGNEVAQERRRLQRWVEYDEPIINYLKAHASEYGLRFYIDKRKKRKRGKK